MLQVNIRASTTGVMFGHAPLPQSNPFPPTLLVDVTPPAHGVTWEDYKITVPRPSRPVKTESMQVGGRGWRTGDSKAHPS